MLDLLVPRARLLRLLPEHEVVEAVVVGAPRLPSADALVVDDGVQVVAVVEEHEERHQGHAHGPREERERRVDHVGAVHRRVAADGQVGDEVGDAPVGPPRVVELVAGERADDRRRHRRQQEVRHQDRHGNQSPAHLAPGHDVAMHEVDREGQGHGENDERPGPERHRDGGRRDRSRCRRGPWPSPSP